ncbi:DUF106 domain-containing protein [Candidatus Woesearchaeota archaeon]|nr:DUF106 domain-containing protein [Candidatus Woesearchaeota archaeon]
MAFLDPLFNPVLLPLLNLVGPFWGIFLLSLIISLIVTVIYKYTTNQELMKRLKDEQKSYSQKLKELRSNPEEMMKVQKEAMKVNMEYMKLSFKPTLITMLPILLIFGWMAGHLSYEPIYPDETYSITALFKAGITGEAELVIDDKTMLVDTAVQPINNSRVTWKLNSKEGEHLLTIKSGNSSQDKKVLIAKEFNYAEAISVYQHSDIEKIQIDYNELRPLGPTFSIWGWQPGWISIYIIFSLVFSLALRKAFKLY